MKKLVLFLCFAFSLIQGRANHITGGEMFYTLIGQSGNDYTYQITLKLYRDCNSNGAPLDPQAAIGIYRNDNSVTPVWSSNIPLQIPFTTLNLTTPGPCIQNPPTVCYQVGFYTFNVTLAGTPTGYTVAYQRCCRIMGINNLVSPSSSVGATYSCQIPGTTPVATGPANNSARFTGADTVIVCANSAFCYDFGAVDQPVAGVQDSLAYSFCTAFTGGTTGTPAPTVPSPPSTFTPVPYQDPFAPSSPLGNSVTLDPRTGVLCGTAPPAGIYVVTVCVTEFRNGIAIATQRKDLQIKVGDCNIAQSLPGIFDALTGAQIQPTAAGCRSFTYAFENLAQSPLINSFRWEFSDGAVYNTARPSHTFADTGVYSIKLVINPGQQCNDSATVVLRVFPGFFPGFDFNGFCVNKPVQFTDTTRTRYGFVDSWRWDFGETTVTNDTSRLQNPVYNYPTIGPKDARLIVTTNKGCLDTVVRRLTILNRPPITLLTKDTLMCVGDTIQLGATGNGQFTWTPNTNIINPNTANPLVYPVTTTNYFVQLDDNGCIGLDTVRVRVVSFVTLQAMPDTTICLTDSIRLRINSDGLRYTWTPAAGLSDPTAKNPTALPGPGVTTYSVLARIGRCIATDDVNVRTVPYPTANAGTDFTLCYNTGSQINASITGSRFTWSPTRGLDNPASLTPFARPLSTTRYVLSAFDTLGCPKPGLDTVLVTVLPEVIAFAGRDTSVVVNQPLQFNATGGRTYAWSPTTALTNPGIANPVATYNGSFDQITYFLTVTDENNCSDVDTINVRIFRTAPQVFVPSAFTPNGDGRNDFFRPIAVGITKIDYFRVYNRWGQLVFETRTNEMGWDGRINGVPQATNTYAWVVKGEDYTGKVVTAKGTVTLIR